MMGLDRSDQQARSAVIVAVADNGVIGRAGQMPWHLPAELKRFKRRTMGHTLVMGRVTFESIGRPLPGRLSIVVTRQRDYQAPGCVIVPSLERAIEEAPAGRQIYVIGGRQLFAEALPIAGMLIWTQVHATIEGETYFPFHALQWSAWRLVEETEFPADAQNAWAFTERVYRRLLPADPPQSGP
jgi:dihydrofolate reductase